MPPGPQVLGDLLSRCDRLRGWAKLQGFGLEPIPEDLALLDEAIDRVSRENRQTRMPAVESEAGQFLGTVIVSTIDGAQWRLWPNGHPVVRLASGRDLDVIALSHDRVARGHPRLADVYADAASNRSG